MKVSEYDKFVTETDQYREKPANERRLIALYGLAGEIGSLFSAIKKKLLAEDGKSQWDQPTDEIKEEIGDVVWYCFSLAQIENQTTPVNILTVDIASLKREIGEEDDDRSRRIRAALDQSKKEKFCKAAESFPSTKDMNFDHYQELAFLTARASGRNLLEVCLAVLWQLSAELLRKTLPEIEIRINRNVADRPVNRVLGEIAWHLCAIASLHKLSMNSIVAENVRKLNFRRERGEPTPLYDDGRKASEQFPRKFDIAIVNTQRDISRMYFQGRQLGHDLNDNFGTDDGYRFHDVLHLSNLAHLGWSPVFRGFMGKKRKTDEKLDRVEDGARAQLVEELVVKAIHSEGERLAKESGRCSTDGPVRFFANREMISFRFLKSLRILVEGHEVGKNQHWEWIDAIYDGADMYYNLRKEQQGTLSIDLESRKISFSPDVCVDLKGVTVGLGMGRSPASISSTDVDVLLTQREKLQLSIGESPARLIAAKRAIMKALGFKDGHWQELEVKLLSDDKVCLKAYGKVQERMWDLKAISFRVAIEESGPDVQCTAIAIADTKDFVK